MPTELLSTDCRLIRGGIVESSLGAPLIIRPCLACGTRFVGETKGRLYCNNCKNVRAVKRFVGVDGEGVTRPDGTHEYILLSVGDRSLYRKDGSRLTFYDIIPFLWDSFLADPHAIYVGFYLGYDFTQWVRDLPEDRARILLTDEGISKRRRTKSGGNHLPFPVDHRGWKFDMLGMKRFRLWEDGSSLRMYICDTGPYFQTSFLNAIDPAKWPDGAVVTDEEFKKIATGKGERGTVVEYGTPVDPEMIEYNVLENDVLGRLMDRYNKGLREVGISLKRDQWYGPGQAAQSWMNKVKAPTRESFEEATSLEIRNILRSSYYGGWFEIFAHGHIPGDSWAYDINSAYPHVQSQLPCPLHGMWTKGDYKDFDSTVPHSFTLVYATVSGEDEIVGSAMHRLHSGNILRPRITEGWYWVHELLAGIAANVVSDFTIQRWIKYEPCDCSSPFAGLRDLYQSRLRVGKNSVGGRARRLIYNSTYGKTAQSIGVAKYANPFYASLITSLCRTQILEAIASHPNGTNDVLMVATDGIVFRGRHPSLDIDPERLGAWDESKYSNLTLFMPGVYWHDDTRERLREGQAPSLKSRGVPARVLADKIFDIDASFHDVYSGDGFPTCVLPINFSLVSPKQALARGKWETCGTVIHDAERLINSDPFMKRVPVVEMIDGIIRSFCYNAPPGGVITTTPYKKMFGDRELEEHMTPDGDFDMLFSHALKE